MKYNTLWTRMHARMHGPVIVQTSITRLRTSVGEQAPSKTWPSRGSGQERAYNDATTQYQCPQTTSYTHHLLIKGTITCNAHHWSFALLSICLGCSYSTRHTQNGMGRKKIRHTTLVKSKVCHTPHGHKQSACKSKPSNLTVVMSTVFL